jgi:hypothetical protein
MKPASWAENPRVGSSILSLGTSKKNLLSSQQVFLFAENGAAPQGTGCPSCSCRFSVNGNCWSLNRKRPAASTRFDRTLTVPDQIENHEDGTRN